MTMSVEYDMFQTYPRMLRTASFAIATLGLCGCATNQPPVPLVGRAADIAALAGEWVGEYSSNESGRSGSISFTLRAASDSAFGDVVMIPAGWGRPLTPWRGESTPPANQRPMSEVLTINFVRDWPAARSEEHTSELQSHHPIS